MVLHKIYGYCRGCYEGVISVTKSSEKPNKNTLYLCPKCKKYNTFCFDVSNELKRRIKEKRNGQTRGKVSETN